MSTDNYRFANSKTVSVFYGDQNMVNRVRLLFVVPHLADYRITSDVRHSLSQCKTLIKDNFITSPDYLDINLRFNSMAQHNHACSNFPHDGPF
jgi:hypothetical protein